MVYTPVSFWGTKRCNLRWWVNAGSTALHALRKNKEIKPMHAARFTLLAGLAFMLPVMFPLASAQQGQPVAGYRLLKTITIPGGLAGNDISWVDSANARYYLADRGNATASPVVGPRVDVIDTQNNVFVASVPLPSPANGILAIPRSHEIWVGLNDSTIAVIDTSSNTIIHVINLGGTARADEIGYDPADG